MKLMVFLYIFAHLKRENKILWNTGSPNSRKEVSPSAKLRAHKVFVTWSYSFLKPGSHLWDKHKLKQAQAVEKDRFSFFLYLRLCFKAISQVGTGLK